MGIPMRPPEAIPSSPFLAIWLHPRLTMRSILEANPRRLILRLTAAYGLISMLDTSINRRLADAFDPAALAFIILVVGPLLAILTLYLNSWATHLTGSWLGGRGSPVSIRAAQAWSGLPVMAGSALTVAADLLLYGPEAFTSHRPHAVALLASSPAFATLAFVVQAVAIALVLILAVWAAVLGLICLSEALRISVWRAIAAQVLALLLLGVSVICLGLLITLPRSI